MQQPYGELKVFAGSACQGFGRKVAEYLGIQLSAGEAVRFTEGNTFVRILENVRGRDVYIIQGLSYPVNDNFVELLFWLDAFRLASAAQVTAVIPFFSYGKGDKKDEPRVSIRARVCADCIEAAGADRVLTMDLHSPQIQGFFRKPVDHLYAMPVLCDYFRAKQIPNLVVASPDVGFGKQAVKFAELLGTPVAIGTKERLSPDQVHVWTVIGDVRGKNVLIVDDMALTGKSLIEMARAVIDKGAEKVYAAVTHGVLVPGAAEAIANSPIEELVITDTVEYRFEPLPPNVRVVSVAPLFAEAIKSIHERTSISRLFPPRIVRT